ncbi:hypothetical protein [Neobacillus jeddahensis]|uniref:hypothetical protein n=1 Tax=Neobacillus jeddahensis TaxID=1461580 RepID=UPI000AA8E347|nr:hypothetical protein [Neobacillus jeddahensis]
MITNQRGNALITVLLISLVFTTLGLAIVSSSISGAKRVENRETDINLSFNAMKVVEEVTTNITKSLNTMNLDFYMDKTSPSNITIFPQFDPELRGLMENSLISIRKNHQEQIDCLAIIDESGSTPERIGTSGTCINNLSKFTANDIETDKDFTRVFEIVLITKNPNKQEGQIKRTIRKRIILSPLPSFLKYAVGSNSDDDDSGLILNGSPNINGNTYANKLTIDEKARYQLRDTSWKSISTPMPSIMGDMYSSTANLLPIMNQADKFYKQKVPPLKHDSQFIDINFSATFNDQANRILANGKLTTINSDIEIGADFKSDLNTKIKSKVGSIKESGGIIQQGVIQKPISIFGKSDQTLHDIYLIESDVEPIEIPNPVKITGDLYVMSSGNNITFKDDLYVDGDLYVVSYDDIALRNIYVTGNIHLVNFDGSLTVGPTVESSNSAANIYCGDTVYMESKAPDQIGKGIEVNGDMIAGGDLHLNPINTAIKINKNMVINGSLNIKGDDELDLQTAEAENDDLVFDSVVYVGNTATISNVNILGAANNEKELVLLANKDLMITRMNEFNNFKPLTEETANYLPQEDNVIKPLKAFFYTESKAELYGVGSLFYIEGGLFAKNRLEINAIRGEVKNINNLESIQEDKLSRFIVDFNSDVLLHRVDALPIVKQLQIYSDELIME